MKDWVGWHDPYDDPSSSLSARLERVRFHLARALDHAAPGPIRLVSLCAGQGHDVLGVLPGHPRRDDVRAVLVEADPRNAEIARLRTAEAGLGQVLVRQADASLVANFADFLPADVLLLCGIFGNTTDDDIKHAIDATSALCADGATVIWTRHRRPPDITPLMREWFADSGFEDVAFDGLETEFLTGVGVSRLRHRPAGSAGLPDGPLFSFLPEKR